MGEGGYAWGCHSQSRYHMEFSMVFRGESVQIQVGPCLQSELRKMLKVQQNQLKQLTQSYAHFQGACPQSPSPHYGPMICRWCHQPGHFARKCNAPLPGPSSFISTASLLVEGSVSQARCQGTNTHRAVEPQLGCVN